MKPERLIEIEKDVTATDTFTAIDPLAAIDWQREVSPVFRELIAAVRGRDRVLREVTTLLLETKQEIRSLNDELAAKDSAIAGIEQINAQLAEENQALKEALDAAGCAVTSVGFGG